MGGRGKSGGGGTGPSGRGQAARQGGRRGPAGGSKGSSAGSSGGGTKGNGSSSTGGIEGGTGSGGGGSSSSPTPAGTPRLRIEYGPGLSSAERAEQQRKLDALPDHLDRMLAETGTKMWVGKRADQTPGWDEFSRETGFGSDSQIADGREVGNLSFYYGSRNELFISTDKRGGSVNVYVHELGHAVDYQIRGDGTLVSNDPDWVGLHTQFIWQNPDIAPYYQGGPSGTNQASGRKELFAEGFAVYNEYGRAFLIDFVGGQANVADKMIEIWTKYGVIK